MTRLSAAQTRLLGRLRRSQRWSAAGGVALALAGGLYLAYAALVYAPDGDPRAIEGLDRPVTRLVVSYGSLARGLDRIRPATVTEEVLLHELVSGTRREAALLVLGLRGLLGSLACLSGLFMLTVVVERRRLLRIIGQTAATMSPEV